MPRILNIKPNIVLVRKLQRCLHMASVRRINYIRRKVPNRAALFTRIRITPSTGSIRIERKTAAIRLSQVTGTRGVRCMKGQGYPVGRDGLASISVVVWL